jgi:enoyl-CoA hydratase/carnithine racemase
MQQQSSIGVERITPKICKITYSNPPANLLIPEAIYRLHEVVKELSEDEQVQIVLFSSSVNDYFFNHFDDTNADSAAFLTNSFQAETPIWADLVMRLTRAPFISIASIRGRTRGGGNEFALACDLRYASKEKAFFGQPEVGLGILPGGGGSERLPRFIGRDRALEAILSSRDYDADTAERFGWVTRTLPDAELDSFVDEMATRLASFDRMALAAAKQQVNRATLPPDEDLISAFKEFVSSLSYPGFGFRGARLGQLIAENGPLNVEKNLGHFIGLVNKK